MKITRFASSAMREPFPSPPHPEQWVLRKLAPLQKERRIILRDPQRMIPEDSAPLRRWAGRFKFDLIFCTGNLQLRKWLAATPKAPRRLLVDRSRPAGGNRPGPPPLFYPDVAAATRPEARLLLTLRDYLADAAEDDRWPALADDRLWSALILEQPGRVLACHRRFRQTGAPAFSDADFHRIILSAVLDADLFAPPTAAGVRRLFIEAPDQLADVRPRLPAGADRLLTEWVESAPAPFSRMLQHDPRLIMRAFFLTLLLHRCGAGAPNRSFPPLGPCRDICVDLDGRRLASAARDLTTADPAAAAGDIRDLEEFLKAHPEDAGRLLADLMGDYPHRRAAKILKARPCSLFFRTAALSVLLADLTANGRPDFHKNLLIHLEKEAAAPEEDGDWDRLLTLYRRVDQTLTLVKKAHAAARRFSGTDTKKLTFGAFDAAWRRDGLCRLEYCLADLWRGFRLRQADCLPDALQWADRRRLFADAEARLLNMTRAAYRSLARINRRFQDLYLANYARWIREDGPPPVFTHQFIPRFLKPGWNGDGKKAYILIFDGMRWDAWQEFLVPVFAERFRVAEEAAGSAILPTETDLSRKAVSAGCLPEAFPASRENHLLEAGLKTHLNLQVKLEVQKEDRDQKAWIATHYASEELEVIIFNFTDAKLHHETSDLAFVYHQLVQSIVTQEISLLLKRIEPDAVVFVTSDHGFSQPPDQLVKIPLSCIRDPGDVKHLNARLTEPLPDEAGDKAVLFKAADLGIPVNVRKGKSFSYVAFPRPPHAFKRPGRRRRSEKYAHGGLSMAECLVPMVRLEPRREP